jgi:hypothetical protein
MNFIRSFLKSWRIAWHSRKVIGWMYVLILLSALLATLPARALLKSKAGHSLMIEDLVQGFNYTFLNDFMNAYGAGLAPVLQSSLWSLLLFVVLLLFFTGGILSTIIGYPNKFSPAVFWPACARFFWRMARLAVYHFICQAGLFLLFGWFYLKASKGLSLAELKDDRIIIDALLWLLPPYSLIALFFLCWQDYARMLLIKNDSRWLLGPIRQAFQIFRRRLLGAYGLYLAYWLLLVIGIALQASFTGFEGTWPGFLLVQIWLIVRLSIRVANWSGVWVVVAELSEEA